jgi:hypothetical protein
VTKHIGPLFYTKSLTVPQDVTDKVGQCKSAGFAVVTLPSKGATVPLQCDRSRELKLHFGSRGNVQCAGGMSIPRLSRRSRPASGLETVRLYRNIAAIHRNRRKFQS